MTLNSVLFTDKSVGGQAMAYFKASFLNLRLWTDDSHEESHHMVVDSVMKHGSIRFKLSSDV